MENEFLEKINEELSFEELSSIAKTALAALYRKLQEEGFSYNQYCAITSIGSDAYYVDGYIMDAEYSPSCKVDWPPVYWL